MNLKETYDFWMWIRQHRPNIYQDVFEAAKWRRKAPIVIVREMEGGETYKVWRAWVKVTA